MTRALRIGFAFLCALAWTKLFAWALARARPPHTWGEAQGLVFGLGFALIWTAFGAYIERTRGTP